MLKVENVEIFNLDGAIRGLRNPMNSWDKSDSELHYNCYTGTISFKIGKNDLELMQKLYIAGHPHRKYLRQIFVCMDIIAPLYWWKEFDTYKVGVTANSCSTMHTIHKKEFELDDFSHEHLNNESVNRLKFLLELLNIYRESYIVSQDKQDWWQMIQLLPSSYNQKRTVTMNYENVMNILDYRQNHKLDEWNDFCDILKEDLPYVKEIIEYDKTNGCSKGNG